MKGDEKRSYSELLHDLQKFGVGDTCAGGSGGAGAGESANAGTRER